MSASLIDLDDVLAHADELDDDRKTITLLQLLGAGLVTQHYVVTNLPFDLPCPADCEGHPRGTP